MTITDPELKRRHSSLLQACRRAGLPVLKRSARAWVGAGDAAVTDWDAHYKDPPRDVVFADGVCYVTPRSLERQNARLDRGRQGGFRE